MFSKGEEDFLAIPRILWNRRLWILSFLILGLTAGWVALERLPNRYQASTMILVEPQKVPSEYVKTTVTSSVNERLRTIEQQITNRENLERIILELDLYPELRRIAPMEQVVGHARRALTVKVEKGATFRVSFKGPDPIEVSRAANRIAELFIEENLKVREGQAERTTQFLEVELEDLRDGLEEQEAKVAQYRALHEGELPEQRQDNLAAIARLEAELAANRDTFESAEIRKLLMERDLAPVGGGGVSSSTSVSRLDELRLQLAEMRSRFTERHPDVIRLQREVAALEAQPPEAEPAEETTLTPRADPRLEAEFEALGHELERLESERQEILADILRIERRLEQTARVGQELLILTRDYDNLRDSYQSLLAKRMEARLAENLERSQQSEQFRILEQAVPPAEPFFPNPLFCLGGGLLAGLGLGVGLALLREETDQTFGNPRSLQAAFPEVAVLPSIPLIRRELDDPSRASAKESKSA